MTDPKQQAMIDARTWMPVAFFTFVETHEVSMGGKLETRTTELHQMWVSALGQTEWRKIETRNLQQMAKAYAQCQAFNERPHDPDDDTVPF